MTNRAQYLLLAAALSIMLWAGMIWGGIALTQDGIDPNLTASTH